MMDKEKLKQEIKNAIDQVRYDNEEEINGKWYLDTTVLVGEIVTSNVIDRIVDKHIPEGTVVLTKRETQHYYAFKAIEPEIRGCMDRERQLKKELEQRNKEIKELNIANKNLIFQLQCHDDEVQRLGKENGKLRFERDFAQKIVRKETAKEILQTLKGLIKEPWLSYELTIDDLKRIAEKNGVEVE